MARTKGQVSLKRIGVDKTNTRIVMLAAVSAFLVMFFLVGSYSLFNQLTYQNRVISAKKKAVKQLEANLEARDTLVKSYQSFVATPQNLIGGSPTGKGPQDGNNARLVLDALPSKYDFPALATSVEKMALDQGTVIESITGTDDEVAQSEQQSASEPKTIEMPFEFTVNGNYAQIQKVIEVLDRSIRPIQVQSTKVSGDQQDLTLFLSAKTFYQPEKSLNIKMETVK